MHTTAGTLVRKYDSPSGRVSFVYFQVDQTFNFLEGQFVMIEAEINGKVIKRPYSIATTNKLLQEEKELGIVVKKTSDYGMSDWLTQHISIGDTVSIKGPVGHYVDPGEHKNYLFVSVGSGLSPNVGLFEKLVYQSHTYDKIVNIFGERYHKHIVPQIEDLFIDHGQEHIQNLFYLSQEENLPNNYTAGYVQDGIQGAIQYLGVQTTCFLCGKPEMVDEVSALLQQGGILKQQIIFEKY